MQLREPDPGKFRRFPYANLIKREPDPDYAIRFKRIKRESDPERIILHLNSCLNILNFFHIFSKYISKMSNKTSVADLIKHNKNCKIETSVADLLKPKKKYLYTCNCILCNGEEVDPRTLKKHAKDKRLWKLNNTRKDQENAIMTNEQNLTRPNSKKRKIDDLDSFQLNNSDNEEGIPPDSFPDSFQLNDEENINTFSSNFRVPASELDKNDDDNYENEEETDDNTNQEEENEGENIFTSPKFDSDEVFVMENLNDSLETEIILWLFKFQQRFRLTDTALEALIKFLHIVLTRLNNSQFKKFPNSLFKAKGYLNILQPKMQLAVCNNCHKMHNVEDIVTYKKEGKIAIKNCLHEEFPDNPTPSRRNQCNNPLTVLKKRKGETIAVPRILYPKPSICQQLSMLYQRPGFENMLKSSGFQRNGDIYSDIYDGKVWKTFPFDGSTFFTPETATTHLGLLINLDWFQPFTYTQHSTGAIYASICNLPRSERNKPENIIYLGFLPGPKEVGLERINHYLAPIVNEFLKLWKGWKVPKTYQCPDGLNIKVALIVGSSDIPATRKLFGHGSAVMKCHRCEKRSIYSEEYNKTHYGGDHNYEISTAESHRKYAHEWLQCNSKNSRDNHFKKHGVRWSELLRLPYMDPIRFAAVDPMHCLFLGVAKWIIKSIFVNQGKLSMEQLRVAQIRMDHVELPSDIGRIPPKIAIGNDGFSNLTADQWKTFIMIYSTNILWDMLDNSDRKILGHFVRACNLLAARFITEDDLKEAQERLKDMAHLIENTYGPEFITSNIHLALHIPDCCRDYGPIYSYWLFPFERLNGYIGKVLTLHRFLLNFLIGVYFLFFLYLGSYPNSNRQIEPELMKIVLKNTLVDYHLTCKWTSGLLDKSLCLLMARKTVGSLALTEEREELQHFLSMRHNISTFSKIYGTEKLPGQMLKPSYFKVIMPLELRNFLCEWYSILYEKEQGEILGFMDLIVNQHARLQIGAEIFGSMISSLQERNATIFAKWKAANDESIDAYPGEVQYYFEHTLRFPEGPKTHLLAYVKWYKCAPSSDIRFKHNFMRPDISNTELWKTEYYEEGCDSLLPVHRILCRATKFKYVTIGKQNYLSIIPLNRKFNL